MTRAAATAGLAASALLTACSPCKAPTRRYAFCEAASDANAVVQGTLASRGELSSSGPDACPTEFRAFTYEAERSWPSSFDGGTTAYAVEGDLGGVAEGTAGLFFLVLSTGRPNLHVDGFYAREDGGYRLAGAAGNALLSEADVLRQVQRVADGDSCSAPATVP